MKEEFPSHGGNLAWAAERYGLAEGDFLDFSSNVNPLGPSPRAMEAARASLEKLPNYPEPHADGLKRELASYLGVEPGLLVLGNGSTELIYHLVSCLAPRRVSVVSPAFGECERAALRAGAEVAHLQLRPESAFELEARELARAAAGSGLTFVCNPASPTGRLYDREELLPALEACRERGGVLAVDQSFMGFCPPALEERASLMPEAGTQGLVIISTLTKLFALAGLRGPGWLAAPPDMASRLEERAAPWRVNVVAAAAARVSLKDEEYVRRTRTMVAEWREEMARRLSESAGCRVFPSAANFLLLRLPDGAPPAAALADELGRRGILVRVCGDFRGLEEGYIRVSVRTPRDNQRLIEALGEVVKSKLEA